ncbi:RcnB family protein [Phenylobacterium sp. LH3H17]|uniref:RcnB family protein n=1 Tax=Phenylobacterium sp. LH3H17 TaxID=2903901 RepID=UPI0020C9912F|nr:RcnB family protein [Phenylobacterium sp. LH3H17]UTP40054.1 RcnB family protein [Phenylobacterium sp. LH3H17]
MKKILTATMALAVLASAGAASAQPHNGVRHDDRRDEQRHDRQDERRDDRRDYRDDRREDRSENRAERRAERRYDRHVQRAHKHYRAAEYQRPSAYRYHQWTRGERLPASYRAAHYRIDHRHYGLRAPPRGYYYTRVDNDVVLTAAASGLIASVIVGLFQ